MAAYSLILTRASTTAPLPLLLLLSFFATQHDDAHYLRHADDTGDQVGTGDVIVTQHKTVPCPEGAVDGDCDDERRDQRRGV